MQKLSWSNEDLSAFYEAEDLGMARFDLVQSEACIEAIVFHECPSDVAPMSQKEAFDMVECQTVISYL